MTRTTRSANDKIASLLDSIGVKYEMDDFLHFLIDRTSMVQAIVCGDEQGAYDEVLKKIKETCPGLRPMWIGRSDDWMRLAVYISISPLLPWPGI